MAAAPRVWFRLEGAASAATSVVVPSDTIVDDLRDKIKEKLKPKLDHVAALDLVLSTADHKTTYSRASQPVSTIDATTEDAPLIVTGTFVRAARLSVRGGLWSSQFLWLLRVLQVSIVCAAPVFAGVALLSFFSLASRRADIRTRTVRRRSESAWVVSTARIQWQTRALLRGAGGTVGWR
jgi:hypothetical protein